MLMYFHFHCAVKNTQIDKYLNCNKLQLPLNGLQWPVYSVRDSFEMVEL